MPIKPTRWKLQHSNRSKGRYFQAVHGKGKSRLALTLGYLTEAEADMASSRVGTLPAPSKLFQVSFTGADGAMVATSKKAKTAVVRQLLLDCDLEEAVEAVAHSASAQLEATGSYAEMRLRDFFQRVWLPIRTSERAAGTVKRETWLWESHLLPALGDVKVKNLDGVKWSRFLASKATWGGRTKAICQTAYRTCLTYAAEIGAIDEVHRFRAIPKSTKVQKPKVPLLAHEVTALLEAASSEVHRALYAAAIGQGLRPSEAVALRWEDLGFQDRTVHVRGTKTELSKATIPMTPLTRSELRSYWVQLGQPSEGPCFLWRGRPIRNFKRSIRAAGERAGIASPVTPYVCRHTFAVLATMNGIPKAATRRMMRHSHASTILEGAYSNVREEQVRDAFSDFQLPGSPSAAK